MTADGLLTRGEGDTVLSEEEQDGLRLTYVATRADLLDAEQRNIAAALLRRPPAAAELLDDQYLRELHRAMFGRVWEWAGRYRTSEKNLGVAPHQIAGLVRELTRDAQYWVEARTYPPDDLAVRFGHRLVWIHPFANGNGRHSRISADYLVRALGGPPFSWGAGLDIGTDELRARYRAALRQADAGDIDALVAFARE